MAMNILELTPQQLKRAATIKEQIDALKKELGHILDGSSARLAASKVARPMSAAVKKKTAAAQKARWAKVKSAKE